MVNGLVVSGVANFVAYSCWTLLNKWQFSPHPPPLTGSTLPPPPVGAMWGLGVSAPIFVTAVQMLLAGATAAFFIFVLGVQKRKLSPLQSALHGCDNTDIMVAPLLSWPTLRERILPLGLARSIDIGCANAALVTVSVAVQQVIKSLLPVFVSLLSITVLNTKVPAGSWIALVPVVSGTIMATMHPSSADEHYAHLAWSGVVLATISCFARSFKAVLNAKLLKPPGKHSRSSTSTTTTSSGGGGAVLHTGGSGASESNAAVAAAVNSRASSAAMMPLEILLLEAPTSGLILLVVSLVVEHRVVSEQWPIIASAALVNVAGGLLMFVNQWSYITVIEKSSAVTCQVIMNAKMLTLVLISVHLFGTPFGNVNYAGVIVAAMGCVFYSVVTSRSAQRQRQQGPAKSRFETV